MDSDLKNSGGYGEPPRVKELRRDDAGGLILQAEGGEEPVADVKLARYFPWSLPDCFISVRSQAGRELALIRSIDDLDPATQQLVQEELAGRVFNPRITRVFEHKREFGMTTVKAETDRGPVTFQMNGRTDVRVLSATRALFRDVDGNRYELPDVEQLDATSRKLVHQYF